MNIAIAAKFMMPELGLTDVQMGQVFSAFMLGYAIFQVPWGMFGDRVGPHKVLTIACLAWAVCTALTGFLPGRSAAFATLIVLRFLLGVGEAAMYPLAARSIANWMPASERAFGYSIIIAGAAVGSAITGPSVSWLMVALSWRVAFYLTSILALAIATIWYVYARNEPEHHAGVTAGELAIIHRGRLPRQTQSAPGSWKKVLTNRNIALICLSYFLDSYVLFVFVFWLYLYLVEQRHFSVLQGGLFTSLPYIVALFVVPLAGLLCDRLCVRFSRNTGRRFVAAGALLTSAVLLMVGVRAPDATLAMVAISLSVAFLMAAEGPFWSSTIDLAGDYAGAAGGIMNMAGNLGGVVSTALVPVLAKRFNWDVALGSASVLALLAALIWLGIRVDVPRASSQDHHA